MTHLNKDPENPQELSNLRETRMKPPGAGTRFTRWTLARDGSGDPTTRLLKTGTMRERSGKVNKV